LACTPVYFQVTVCGCLQGVGEGDISVCLLLLPCGVDWVLHMFVPPATLNWTALCWLGTGPKLLPRSRRHLTSRGLSCPVCPVLQYLRVSGQGRRVSRPPPFVPASSPPFRFLCLAPSFCSCVCRGCVSMCGHGHARSQINVHVCDH
jgi:hypothetical protein